ncbi:hypothetical protein HPB50_010705 [Hyalomma asiaticum]|uniref:Uncharacterized protein n=1 Tax=Hyalomma asiaticum TaxID=266040 RepID=A0ACB7SGA4_HYAAI|nr:hypothetical protein HPB50_010705 [Hyalomma asiaticum]
MPHAAVEDELCVACVLPNDASLHRLYRAVLAVALAAGTAVAASGTPLLNLLPASSREVSFCREKRKTKNRVRRDGSRKTRQRRASVDR